MVLTLLLAATIQFLPFFLHPAWFRERTIYGRTPVTATTNTPARIIHWRIDEVAFSFGPPALRQLSILDPPNPEPVRRSPVDILIDALDPWRVGGLRPQGTVPIPQSDELSRTNILELQSAGIAQQLLDEPRSISIGRDITAAKFSIPGLLLGYSIAAALAGLIVLLIALFVWDRQRMKWQAILGHARARLHRSRDKSLPPHIRFSHRLPTREELDRATPNQIAFALAQSTRTDRYHALRSVHMFGPLGSIVFVPAFYVIIGGIFFSFVAVDFRLALVALVFCLIYAAFTIASFYRKARTRFLLTRHWIPPSPTDPAFVCHRCGYSLLGNTTGICPECAAPTTSATPPAPSSTIPRADP